MSAVLETSGDAGPFGNMKDILLEEKTPWYLDVIAPIDSVSELLETILWVETKLWHLQAHSSFQRCVMIDGGTKPYTCKEYGKFLVAGRWTDIFVGSVAACKLPGLNKPH